MLLTRFITAAAIALAAPLAAQPVLAAGQTLVYARGADSLSLDPAAALSSEDFKVPDWVFDGLVRFTGDTTKIEPSLATSWERSEDGLVWTFHLRKGVKFQDGTPFDGDAVKVSFERQFDKNNPYYSPRFLRWHDKLGDMTKVEVVDENTVKLHFTKPQPALLDNLAIYPAYIVSPAALKKDAKDFMNHPVGTGPFKFVRWEKNNLIELARNDDYWDGPAKLDRIIVRVIPDNDVRLLALQKGEVQMTDDVPFNRLASIEKDPSLKVQKVGAVGFSGVFLNAQSDKLKDVRVRKAIEHAINRKRVFAISFFKQGEFADQPMPPKYMGHADDVTAYDYDPEKAKQLLQEAGVKGKLKLNFLVFANPRPYFPSPTDGVAMIKADLAKVGIDAEVQTATWSDWVARHRQNDFDLTIGGWTASTVDPDGVLYPVYSTKSIGTDNTARYSDPKLDDLMLKARSTYDEKQRDDLYKQATKMIADAAVTVFFAHPIYTLGMRENVEGAYRNPANQVPLHDVSIKAK